MAPVPSTASAPLTFDQFWRWLSEHRNCLVRCGTADMQLFDHESLHWDFFDEDGGQAIVQGILGKALVGELIVERADVVFVQGTPDVENPQSGHWVFECQGGKKEESYPLYVFVMAHGMEGAGAHQPLKH